MFFKTNQYGLKSLGKEKIEIVIDKSHGFNFIGYQVASDAFSISSEIEAGYEFSLEGESDSYWKDNKKISQKIVMDIKIKNDDESSKNRSNIIGNGYTSLNKEKKYGSVQNSVSNSPLG